MTQGESSKRHNTTCQGLYRKKRGIKKDKTYQTLPNALEIADLQQGRQDYGSLGFRLKIDELLKNILVNHDSLLQDVEAFLHVLKKNFDSLHSKEIGSELKKHYPFMFFTLPPRSFHHYDHSFTFKPPVRCDVVGSYLLKTCVPPNYHIDIAVEMPSDIFKPKDYLNYRYFNKRAAYLAEMFLQLRNLYPYTKEEEMNGVVHQERDEPIAKASTLLPYFFLQPLNGDASRPIILIKFLVTQKLCKDNHTLSKDPSVCPWVIRVFAVPPENVFSFKYLAPYVNGVRFCSSSRCPQELQPVYSCFPNEANSHLTLQLPPTPMYNGAIAQDITMRLWVRRFICLVNQYKGFRDAVRLLKLWAYVNGHDGTWNFFRPSSTHQETINVHSNNRDSDKDVCHNSPLISGITGFLLTVLCSHTCIINREVLLSATPLQIFRAVLLWIAEVDFSTKKVVYGEKQLLPLEVEESMLHMFLMLDNQPGEKDYNGSWNILWSSQLFIQELQFLARKTVAVLDAYVDPFPLLFDESTSKYSSFLFWDMFLKLPPVLQRDHILSESTLARTHELELERSKRVSEFQETKDKKGSFSKPLFLDFHMEHPGHYNFGGFLTRLIKRSLGNRLAFDQGVFVRFEIVSLPYIKSTPPFMHNGTHPLQVPLLGWTDLSVFNPRRTSLGVMIGVCFSSSPFSDKPISFEASSTMPWSIVDRGYPVKSLEAKIFSEFWGNASVRRFGDGSINYSVIWKSETPTFQCNGQIVQPKSANQSMNYTPSVPKQILTYILNRYLKKSEIVPVPHGANATDSYSVHLIDSGLQLQLKPVVEFFDRQGKKKLPHPLKLFQEIKSKIFGLSNLPLAVKEVHCTDDNGVFYYADIPTYISGLFDSTRNSFALSRIVDCVVEFNKGFGWPTDRQGIIWMKVALLVELRNGLLKNGFSQAEIGGVPLSSSESKYDCKDTTCDPFLDVLLDSCQEFIQKGSQGVRVLYRLRIFHPPQHFAIASALTEPSSSLTSLWKTYPFMDAAVHSLRDTWWKARRNAALLAAALEFPCFASTLRLTKIWAASQLFPLNLVQDLFSHIALYLFKHPQCYGRPTTAWTGFLQLLRCIAYYDWHLWGMFLDYNPSVSSISEETYDILKASRQRCQDVIRERSEKPYDGQTMDLEPPVTADVEGSTAPRFPFFWITTLDDPHCQFIQLPQYSMAKHLVEVARHTLETIRSVCNGKSFKTVSQKSDNYIQQQTFYPWRTPLLQHLLPSKWQELFNPTVAKRFDLVVRFHTNTLDSAAQEMSQSSIMSKANQADTRHSRFMNLDLSKDHIEFSETQGVFILPDPNETSGKHSLWTNVIHSLDSAFQDVVQQTNTSKQSFMSSTIQRALQSIRLPSGCAYLESTPSHDITSFMQSVFHSYVGSLRSLLGSAADIYYDSLALPYPSALFIKFNPTFFSPRPFTPFASTLCPKALIREDLTTSSMESSHSASLKDALEIPNVPILLAMILSLGCSIVDTVHLL